MSSATAPLHVLLILLPLSLSLAQEPEGPAPELTIESMQARIQAIEANQERPAELKASLLEKYRAALESLNSASAWRTRAAEFEQARTEAPALLDKLREELRTPAPEPSSLLSQSATLALLEAKEDEAAAALAAAQKLQRELEDEVKKRASNRADASTRLPLARQELQQTDDALAKPVDPEQPAEVTGALRIRLLAQKESLKAEIDAIEKQTLSYDARRELLTARRDLAEQKVRQAVDIHSFWRSAVSDERRFRARQVADQARRTRAEIPDTSLLLAELADQNVQLADLRVQPGGLLDQVADARKGLTEARLMADAIAVRARDVESKVVAAGLTHSIGLLLARERAELPDEALYRRNLRQRRSTISEAHYEMLLQEDARFALVASAELVAAAVAELPLDADEAARTAVSAKANDLIAMQRRLRADVKGDYDALFQALVDLSTEEEHLIKATEKFREYIGERIVWVRSAKPLGVTDVIALGPAAEWFFRPRGWGELGSSLGRDARANLGAYLALLVGLLAGGVAFWALLRRWKIKDALDDTHSRHPVRHALEGLVPPTLLAGLCTALTLFVAWRLGLARSDEEHPRALSAALTGCAAPLFVLLLLYRISRVGGLAVTSFGWNEVRLKETRRVFATLLMSFLPAWLLAIMFDSQRSEAYRDSLGRLAFILAMGILTWAFGRMLWPRAGRLDPTASRVRGGGLVKVLAISVPIALAVASAFGYHYTALEFSARLQSSAFLVVGLVLARELMEVALIRKGEPTHLDGIEGEAESPTEEISTEGVLDGTDRNSTAVTNAQTHSLIGTIITVSLFGGLWIIWAEQLPALAFLEGLTAWETIETLGGEVTRVPVTYADVLMGFVVVLITIAAARNLPAVLEASFLRWQNIDTGTRFATKAIMRYSIVVFGVILAFSAIGIGWGQVQWLVAAVSVGLGFGLQEIFANFISGLILLFEQPVRVGDTVTVDGVNGTVTRIQIRATTIMDWDSKELIVPNKTFITGQLVNWSLSDQILRIIVPVGVTYGTDIDRACAELLKVARAERVVLRQPRPQALFLGFGDNSLNLELRVHVASIDHFVPCKHRLHVAINRALEKAGIVIAFPQRDMHLHTVAGASPFKIELVDPRTAAQEPGAAPGVSSVP